MVRVPPLSVVGVFRSTNILSHFLPSQWLRKGECYSKPHLSMRYKQVFLALKLASEIQYHLCLYISQALFNAGQINYMLKNKHPTHILCNKAISHHLCARALLCSKSLNNKSTNSSLIFLKFIHTDLSEYPK